MNALIDTCVIIDALQGREPFREDAENLFLAAANMRCTAYITAKSVTDIYYLMHRAFHNDADTRKALGNLFTLFELLDTAGLDCRKALLSQIRDYEDAVMVESAIRTDMDCIVTRNIRDFVGCPIPVYTPDKFLQQIAPDE